MFNRLINPLLNNSFFIFGARGTGKSTWIEERFKTIKHFSIDLLKPDDEERLAKNPQFLLTQIEALTDTEWVIIDEIQKLPQLLDLVHLGIEKHKKKFVLTGSSARKLKRGAANLLAGRAFMYSLFPLTYQEMGEAFQLEPILKWGSLPQIFKLTEEADKARYLRAYAQTYLKEEVVAEQIIRKLEPFRHFLEIAAQQNGEILNYSNIARDISVDTVTVQSYFQILEDTLMGFILPPFHQSIRKRQRANPKFYLFDLGVKRALESTLTLDLKSGTYGYGKAFEHFVIAEAWRLNSYLEKDYRFSYLRTKDDAEIDLIIERPGMPLALVEIKSSQRIDDRDIRILKSFLKDLPRAEAYCLSNDPKSQVIDGVKAHPWSLGLQEIGLV